MNHRFPPHFLLGALPHRYRCPFKHHELHPLATDVDPPDFQEISTFCISRYASLHYSERTDDAPACLTMALPSAVPARR